MNNMNRNCKHWIDCYELKRTLQMIGLSDASVNCDGCNVYEPINESYFDYVKRLENTEKGVIYGNKENM